MDCSCRYGPGGGPDDLIDTAIRIRREYLAEVAAGLVEIIDLPAEKPDGDENVVH